MDLNKLFIDKYNNGFMFGDFIIRTNDNIEIKVLKDYLKTTFFYFEAFFNFESNKDKDDITIDYNSKIVNYVILSSLTKKYESLLKFDNKDLIALMKFIDEFGYCDRDKVVVLCEQLIDKHIDKFIDLIPEIGNAEIYDGIWGILLNHMRKVIMYDDYDENIKKKLNELKDASEDFEELDFIDDSINKIMPLCGSILNDKIFGVDKIKARYTTDGIVLNFHRKNNSSYTIEDKMNDITIYSSICRILNKMFSHEKSIDDTIPNTAKLLKYQYNKNYIEDDPAQENQTPEDLVYVDQMRPQTPDFTLDGSMSRVNMRLLTPITNTYPTNTNIITNTVTTNATTTNTNTNYIGTNPPTNTNIMSSVIGGWARSLAPF